MNNTEKWKVGLFIFVFLTFCIGAFGYWDKFEQTLFNGWIFVIAATALAAILFIADNEIGAIMLTFSVVICIIAIWFGGQDFVIRRVTSLLAEAVGSGKYW